MATVSTKELKQRIRSMEATRKITRAMEMVALAKLRREQVRLAGSRAYTEALQESMARILASVPESTSPYLAESKAGKTLYIVIAGDRGLAGGYNSSVLKYAWAEMAKKQAAVLPIGRKSVEFFQSRHPELLEKWHPDSTELTLGVCLDLAKELCGGFCRGEYSGIQLVHTEFLSMLAQRPVSLPLLPLVPTKKELSREILFEPSYEAVLDATVPEYIGGMLFGRLCESRTAEQAARRTAMDSATRNADELISQLRLQHNQARQSAITRQITEIVAGSQ